MAEFDVRMIRHLWAFLVLAEEEHFGRAALRLGISQPPLTEQIRTLEQALGVTLFERSRRGTKLTQEGRTLLPAARRYAEQTAQFERNAREVAQGQSGILQVGAITSAMLEVVPPLLDHLRQRFPALTVFLREIDSGEAIPAIETGDLDLAFIRIDEQPDRRIGTLSLTEDRLAVALPAGHALAACPAVSIADLAQEPLVMSSREVSPIYFDMLVGICRRHGVSPRVLHQVRSVTAQIAYVSCGQGLALVPLGMGRLAPENVVLRPLREETMIVTAAAVWSRSETNPFVAAAVDWLGQQHAPPPALAPCPADMVQTQNRAG